MKKLFPVLIVILVLAGVFFAYKKSEEKSVEAVRPVRGPAVQAVYATGTVEPTVMMPISPRNPARLMELLADEGQEVKKGDVLAQLEDAEFQKQVDEQEARAVLAQKEYERKNDLIKKGAVSKQVVDQAKADFDVALSSLERLKAQQDYYKLVSPEEGRVMKRDGEVGQMIPANQPVFWLSCCAPLRISAEVDEEDIVMVKPGQNVVITADAFPGEIFNGSVTSITPKGDPVARSYRVRVGLTEGETPLMTGMTAETNIIIKETKNALLVPASAIKEQSVLVVNGDKAEKRVVKTGAATPDVIEIREGITENDVIVKDASAVVDGASFKVMDWTP